MARQKPLLSLMQRLTYLAFDLQYLERFDVELKKCCVAECVGSIVGELNNFDVVHTVANTPDTVRSSDMLERRSAVAVGKGLERG